MEISPILYTTDITVFQLRAARRALNLTVRDVGKATALGTGVVVRSESGNLYDPPNCTVMTINRLKSYYESYGIVFLSENTIRINKVIPDIVFRQKNPVK